MKAIKSLFSLLLIGLLLAVPAFAIDLDPGSGADFYVQDTAGVLSAETKDMIVRYNETLEAQCENAQLVVVTVSYLDEDSDVAALQLMNDWGVGSAEQSNGMLLLLVANEYRGWLATGAGIDDRFTDGTAEEYLNKYFWDYIDNDQFDEGVQTITTQLYNWYLDEYGAAESTAAAPAPDYPEEHYHYEEHYYDPSPRGTGLLSVLVFILVIWALVSTSRYSRMRHWGYSGGFWPIFWFGGPRIYRSWHHQHRPGPRGPGGPHGPGPGPGPRPGPGHRSAARPGSFRHGSGFGGHSGGGAGRSGGSFGGGAGRSGGGFGGHGRGFGGRGGGGGGGRR